MRIWGILRMGVHTPRSTEEESYIYMNASKVFYRKNSSEVIEFPKFGRKNIWNMRYTKDSAKQKQKEKGKN